MIIIVIVDILWTSFSLQLLISNHTQRNKNHICTHTLPSWLLKGAEEEEHLKTYIFRQLSIRNI